MVSGLLEEGKNNESRKYGSVRRHLAPWAGSYELALFGKHIRLRL